MKILHVNMTNSGGGLEQYLFRLSEELHHRGHQSHLLFGEISSGPALPFKAQLHFIDSITHPGCRDVSKKLAAAAEILNQERPDVVFFHQVLNPNLVELLSRGHPSLRFAHGFKIVCPDGRKTLKTKGVFCPFPLSYFCQVRAFGYRCMPRNLSIGVPAIRRSKRIAGLHRRRSAMVVASRFMRNVLINNRFREERIAVMPPFTTLPQVQPDEQQKNRPMILSLGRIVEEKGMHCLLQAFASLEQQATLAIIGEGPFLVNLKALAEKLGIRPAVSFPGWLSARELDLYYRKCSMVIVPSLWPEPFGMVGIEAMAYGKPVIAFDVGGISDWLADKETGFLVPCGDTLQLTKKISSLLGDRGTALRMGEKARKIAEEQYTPEIHVHRLLELFNQEIARFNSGK